MSSAYLAIDLGATSGRAIVGVLTESSWQLRLEEVHRFQHVSCPTPNGPVWDLTGLWRNILSGLAAASLWCRENKAELTSVGVDTWGVDWGLLGSSGEMLSLPHCYRDPQNNAACKRVVAKLGGFETLYERTGIQLLAFNTLFQVAARHEREPKLFDCAQRLVFLPDLFHYWLSGEVATERTIASTSSMLAVDSGRWDIELLESLALPTHMLGPIVEAGTELGTLRKEVAAATGASSALKVITPASHDTSSAIAAVPASGQAEWAYLSSGTWSLLGTELDAPVHSAAARKAPFSNERGVEGTICFLKNIAGLWSVEELRRELQERGDPRDVADLVREARFAEPGRTLIDPNHADFATPGNMAEKLRRYARDTSQQEPETIGQLIRTCLESLALCYARTLDQMEMVLNRSVEVLHLVGGGTKNQMLNELTAAAVGRPVEAGPVEATAVGNLLVQAMGRGQLADLRELRQVVANSFPLKTVELGRDAHWRELRDRFNTLISD
jgi:rhamnulokinase